jgi:Clostripain family
MANGDDVTTAAGQGAPDQAPGPKPSWTVMIFMGVNTLEGEQSLLQAFEDDLKEIKAVAGGGAHNLHIFVQAHFGEESCYRSTTVKYREPERYHFGDRDTKPVKVPKEERDYRQGHALENFITYSLNAALHERPTDYTMLVLWGHAYDFTFGRLETPGGSQTALNFVDIRDVLGQVQKNVAAAMRDKLPELPKLDVIGFDACDIATSEVAFQLWPVARFLLASQVGIPVPGWPYHRILDRLKEPKGTQIMSPAELGSYAVRRLCAAYDASTPVSMTMINLHHVDELFDLTQQVAVELATAIEHPETRARIARTFKRSQTEAGKPFVDVADLCLSLMGEEDYPGLVDKARALGDFIAGSRPDESESYHAPEGWPLVVDHDRNSGELVRLNGISLYAPNVARNGRTDEIAQIYRRLDFVKRGRWSGVVHRLAASQTSR